MMASRLPERSSADTEPLASQRPYPLEGLRVLDLSRVLAGPYVGRILSDLGCDVVKLEGPEGDLSRFWGAVRNGASGYYAQHNSGKRNISIDFNAPRAIPLVRRLAAVADILIENFRPGVVDRLGIGWTDLSAANDKLIMLSISGWGQTSDEGERRAFAPVIHAQTGLIDRQSRAYCVPPTDPMLSIADYYAGLHGLIAILSALNLRQRTGQGQYIDMAMFDAMLATDCYAHHYIDGSPVERLGGYIWDAPGGPIVIAADYRHTWERLKKSFHLRDPAPAGSELAVKLAGRRAAIAAWIMSFPNREALRKGLEQAGLVSADIRTSEDAYSSADVQAREMIAEVGDGDGGPRRVVQTPYRFSNASSGVRGPAPGRGEHNDAVLAEWLGMADEEIGALRRDEVLCSEGS